jgi:hypothetical protein
VNERAYSSCGGIKAVEASAGCQPQNSGAVLADVVYEWDGIARKRLSCRFEPVEELVASDPEYAVPIFEERVDVDATEAVGISQIMNQYPEVVAVIPV